MGPSTGVDFWRREKCVAPARIRFPDSPARTLVTKLTYMSRRRVSRWKQRNYAAVLSPSKQILGSWFSSFCSKCPKSYGNKTGWNSSDVSQNIATFCFSINSAGNRNDEMSNGRLCKIQQRKIWQLPEKNYQHFKIKFRESRYLIRGQIASAMSQCSSGVPRAGFWGVKPPTRNSEVLTKLHLMVNWAENV